MSFKSSSPCSAPRNGLAAAITVAIASAYGLLILAHADALRAAGVNGAPPPKASAIKTFVGGLTDNALWLIGTVLVLSFVVVGLLFLMGARSANEYAAKIALGAFIVILAPGLAA